MITETITIEVQVSNALVGDALKSKIQKASNVFTASQLSVLFDVALKAKEMKGSNTMQFIPLGKKLLDTLSNDK